jgi:hypothetical protein
MHTIDRKWIDLSAGYEVIQTNETKLTAEFGRAVRVGHKLQFRKDLSDWQKKRRVFFALVVVALLSIIGLCLTAFYLRDVACVIIYWALLVLIILVTLAVAGRQYILEMVNGKPVPQPAKGLVVDLEGRWWESLSPQELVDKKAGQKKWVDFQALLAHSLPDLFSVRTLSDTDILLLGPSGIWIFKVENWSGTIVKQEGTWKQIMTVRDKLWRKQYEEKTYEPGPDYQWLRLKQEVVIKLVNNLPEQVRTQYSIHGGVAFSHPKVSLDKKRILGNTASYGLPKAWVERILRTPAVEGFTQEMQLEILDVLADTAGRQPISSKDEADRLYHQAVEELRTYVARMVK